MALRGEWGVVGAVQSVAIMSNERWHVCPVETKIIESRTCATFVLQCCVLYNVSCRSVLNILCWV